MAADEEWIKSASRYIRLGPECDCDCWLCAKGEHCSDSCLDEMLQEMVDNSDDLS